MAIQPEAIFIGRGHFDHAGDIGYVAGRTGAPVIAGAATCATAGEQASRDGNGNAFSCRVLGHQNTLLPRTLQRIWVWEDMEEVTVLRHMHSNADPSDLTVGLLPLIFFPELLGLSAKPQHRPGGDPVLLRVDLRRGWQLPARRGLGVLLQAGRLHASVA